MQNEMCTACLYVRQPGQMAYALLKHELIDANMHDTWTNARYYAVGQLLRCAYLFLQA